MNILLLLKLISAPDPLTVFCTLISTLSTKQKTIIRNRLNTDSQSVINEILQAVN